MSPYDYEDEADYDDRPDPSEYADLEGQPLGEVDPEVFIQHEGEPF